TLYADFTAEPRTGPAPLTVTFTDTSRGSPSSCRWTFGDDSAALTQNPTHQYDRIGVFEVSLRARDASGKEDTRTREGFITVVLATPKPLVPATHPIPPELILARRPNEWFSSGVIFKW